MLCDLEFCTGRQNNTYLSWAVDLITCVVRMLKIQRRGRCDVKSCGVLKRKVLGSRLAKASQKKETPFFKLATLHTVDRGKYWSARVKSCQPLLAVDKRTSSIYLRSYLRSSCLQRLRPYRSGCLHVRLRQTNLSTRAPERANQN